MNFLKRNLVGITNFLKRKLKERSTFAGLAFVLGLVGINFTPDAYEIFSLAALSAVGVVEVLRNEK